MKWFFRFLFHVLESLRDARWFYGYERLPGWMFDLKGFCWAQYCGPDPIDTDAG